MASTALPRIEGAAVREALRAGRGIALLDVRDEHRHAQGHPLFAAQLDEADLAQEAPWRLPRREVPVVLFDAGEGLAEHAARRLQSWGYTQVALLARCHACPYPKREGPEKRPG